MRSLQHSLGFLIPLIVICAVSSVVFPNYVMADNPVNSSQVTPSADKQKVFAALHKGATFILKSQDAQGLLAPERAPIGMHALAAKALVLAPGYGMTNSSVQKSYDMLLAYQLETGGIYKDSLASYNTAIAISALAAANNPEFRPAIDKAIAYLKSLQWTDTISGPKGESITDTNPWFGGFGYGGFSRGASRPDLSNTHMALDALHDAGLKSDDPAYQNALRFVSRLQNSSETNDQPWAGDDGGFVYGPSADGKGESFSGEYTSADGKRMLRSYGSMTYAGLKSMVYAGLTKEDPRVKAAWNWICKNWTLDENPGMKAGNPDNAQYGIYYYYLTLARAMHAYGENTITDAKGVSHDWRLELITQLVNIQREDGSWVGEKKWMEDNPILATSYAMLAMEEAVASLDGK